MLENRQEPKLYWLSIAVCPVVGAMDKPSLVLQQLEESLPLEAFKCHFTSTGFRDPL